MPKPFFAIEIIPEGLEVSLDYQMMKAALLNLLVNGCQAMPHGGTI